MAGNGLGHAHGIGAVLRDNDVVLSHVSYWLAEHRDGQMVTTRGHIRGDAKVLTRVALSGAELVLVLDDGRWLPFRLGRHREDPMTWDIEALGAPTRSKR